MTCRVCLGALAERPAFRTRDLNRGIGSETFAYHRCHVCGTYCLEPMPADLDRYYPPSYYELPESVAQLAAAVGPERYKIETVEAHAQGRTLLEIGAGLGGFAYLAREAGYDVEAIEMDERCCSFLATLGVGVHRSPETAEVIEALGREFDVVALWHVVEHLPDPRGTLVAAAAVLRPGGILVVAAPNPESLQFRLLRGRWTHVDAPRHLQLAPAAALFELVRPAGFSVVHRTSDDAGARGWNAFGWEQSLANATRRYRPQRLLRRVGRAAARVAAPLERRDFRGSTYTLVLRKP